jgi:hypothetical protein
VEGRNHKEGISVTLGKQGAAVQSNHRVPHNYLNMKYEMQSMIRFKSLVNYETSGNLDAGE